jgi:putative tRNA adenosine deaminase-associated protein
VSHFALVLLGKDAARSGWLLEEASLDGCESIDDVCDLLRDFDQPVRLLAVEQDDEYAVLARLDLAADQADEPMRVFLSNGHAADDYPIAGLFADGLVEIGGDPLDGDEDAPAGVHDAAPFGDPQVVADLGLSAAELIELAVHEGTLPADLIETVCERLGCLSEFEALRG